MNKLFTLIAVAMMAFASQANVLTVAEGTELNSHYPFYSLYYDTEGTTSQMIYPEDMLTDLVGAEITELKFYAKAPIALINGNLQLSMKVVEETEYATATAITLTEDDVYAHGAPVQGETEVVFTLDKPFVYEGGNLLIETVVTSRGNYATTYFYGISTGLNCAFYSYVGFSGNLQAYTERFLPQVTFTYEIGDTPEPPTPTEKTQAPVGSYEIILGHHEVAVTITPSEGNAFYRIIYTDPEGNVTEGQWQPYVETFLVDEDGHYRIEFYAVAEDKLPSDTDYIEFTINSMTGLEEMTTGKTVAGVRYFNMAGQEMQQAAGMTIVVTTYTDGTTSAVKVIK